MISLWFQKRVWRSSVGTYNGYLCLQLMWEPWAVDVRNVPNGPRSLCSNFSTARRKKVATMNSCIGVNVNLPRREEGSSACMKLNHLNSLGAEYSSHFLIKYDYCQWYASLCSVPPFFAGLILWTKLVRVSLFVQVLPLAEAAASPSPVPGHSGEWMLGCTGTVCVLLLSDLCGSSQGSPQNKGL